MDASLILMSQQPPAHRTDQTRGIITDMLVLFGVLIGKDIAQDE